MRVPYWEDKLAEFLREKKRTPFKWGENDCALFACDWASIATGRDYAAGLRGRYDSAAGAARLYVEKGVSSIEGWADIELPRLFSPTFARRGDIVSIETPRGRALAVVGGAGVAFGPGESGAVAYDMSEWRKAWRLE